MPEPLTNFERQLYAGKSIDDLASSNLKTHEKGGPDDRSIDGVQSEVFSVSRTAEFFVGWKMLSLA